MGNIADMFKPRTPKAQEPVRMPDPEDPVVLEAARRRRASMTGSGRSSTLLGDSDPSSGGGNGMYQKTLLGGG